jgi:DNA invertase Pin-like site-specific DNA recombinase
MTTKRPKAISYVRMSTAEQLKGDSLRRQTEKSAKYAAENGLELDENFKLEDIGVSAFRGRSSLSRQ